jgi:hypothetical protein
MRSLVTACCLVLLALGASLVPDAAGAGLRSGRLTPGMATVLSPRPDAIVQGPSVRARVRTTPGTSLRAWLD